MQVDTGAFQDLAAKVAELVTRAEREERMEEIMRRAGMPDHLRDIADREPPARDRHGMRAINGGTS